MATEEIKGKDELITLALARSKIYRLLSAAYLYPEEEFFSFIQSGIFMDEIRASLACLEKVASFEFRVSSCLNFKLETLNPQLSLSNLQAEYHRIFGHTISKECPLYETQYGNENIFQQTQEMADIAGFYRAFGLEVSDRVKESLDHLAIEFEFMYFLTHKEAYARRHHGEEKVRICMEAQKKFLKEHIGKWVPFFTPLFKRKAEGGFYEQLAILTEDFLASELAYLGVKPEKLTNPMITYYPLQEDFSFPCEGYNNLHPL